MTIRDDQIEFETKGSFIGECRKRYNILEQWNGKRWRQVPDVIIREQSPHYSKIHFDVEDALDD